MAEQIGDEIEHDQQVSKPQLAHLRTLHVVTDLLRRAEAERRNLSMLLPRVLSLIADELDSRLAHIVWVDGVNRSCWRFEDGMTFPVQNSAVLDHFIKHGLAGSVISTKQALSIDDTLTDPRWLHLPGQMVSLASWSAMSAPLIMGDEVIGSITLAKEGAGQFSADDLSLLTDIGKQAAITIDNGRLFTKIQEQLTEAELFNQATRSLNESFGVEDVITQTLRQMNRLIDAQAVSIALTEVDELVYHHAEGLGSKAIKGLRLHQDAGVSGWVMKYARSALVNSPQTDERFSSAGDQRTGHQTTAIICAPLSAQGRVLGTIQAINPPAGQFTDDDLIVLTRFADIASSALSRAQLFTQTSETEARYHALLKDSITPILITNDYGYVHMVNHSAVELLKYHNEQMVGERIDMLHQEPLFEQVSKMIADHDEVKMIKTQVVSAEGTQISVELHVKRTHKDVLQWMYRDVSRQVMLEQMRDDLTVMLLHDLKNPLSNIMSSLELLEEELPPEEEGSIATIMHQVATRSSQWLRHLIHSLLDINRLEAGTPIKDRDVVDTNTMLASVGEIMMARLEAHHVQVRIDVPADLPLVLVNQDMIERVVLNLMDNALKFSQSGDAITLAAEPSAADMLKISVSDQGPGVKPEFRESIFHKYYQSPDNRAKGMGLGLAFCALTVEAHGGRIWVDDAVGGGARFNLTIPVEPSRVAAVEMQLETSLA